MTDCLIEKTKSFNVISGLGDGKALVDLKACTSDEGFITIDVDEILNFEKKIESDKETINVRTFNLTDFDDSKGKIRQFILENNTHDVFLIISGPSLESSFASLMRDINIYDCSSNVIFGAISRPEQREYYITGIGARQI